MEKSIPEHSEIEHAHQNPESQQPSEVSAPILKVPYKTQHNKNDPQCVQQTVSVLPSSTITIDQLLPFLCKIWYHMAQYHKAFIQHHQYETKIEYHRYDYLMLVFRVGLRFECVFHTLICSEGTFRTTQCFGITHIIRFWINPIQRFVYGSVTDPTLKSCVSAAVCEH